MRRAGDDEESGLVILNAEVGLATREHKDRKDSKLWLDKPLERD
jgi:hypothetical protein